MKTRLYLDKRGKNDILNGSTEFPIKVSINAGGSSAYIATGLSVLARQWRTKPPMVVQHPRSDALNIKLAEIKLKIDKAIGELKAEGELHGLSAHEIKRKVEAYIENGRGDKAKEKPVLECFEEYILTKKREGTVRNMRATAKKIRLFVKKADTLTFADITVGWLMDFDDFLSQTAPSANSRSVHLRDIRAVFNYALSEGHTAAPYPFRRFKIRKEPTDDRSLSVEELQRVFSVPCSEALSRYRDIFKLSFLLCGINLADLFALRDLKNGRIECRRIKTGQPLSIMVEPEAAEIIARYRGRGHLLEMADKCSNYVNYLHRMDKALKRLGTEYNPRTKRWEGEPICPDISYYSARYSWATLAAELDIPERTIGAALGHSTAKSVTSIYIRVDMRKKIDAANRKVIDCIFSD